ncbi:MAG: CHAT domain-containing protein [Planctomycetes bacterium]|nr:CHAT domain-containing protein [Planctomycetota bacterium]
MTPADVARALPAKSAVVDFLVHRYYEPGERRGGEVARRGTWTAPHVSAWVVRAGETSPQWIDLGPSAPIAEAVKAFLENLVADRSVASRRGVGNVTSSKERSARETGDRLARVLWVPIAKVVGDAETIFVCPDAFLGTLPFETLPDADGSFLVEKRAFVYLADAASLVEISTSSRRSGSEPSALIVGAIDYDSAGAAPAGSASAAASPADLHRTWSALEQTRLETDGIDRLFTRAFAGRRHSTLQDSAPTEERLKQEISRYSIVHLATHGYFQPEALPSMWDSAQERVDERRGASPQERLVTGYSPGFLSGLVCAGANRRTPGRDDGLLTAEEVGWLDLRGCDLVVLSACETALGTARAGEGMMSLRRAFHLAGAKTVISSLWNVRDESTKDLMLAFYERLWEKGQGKLEALRGAQLEMLARNRARLEGNAMPSTWGAFVLSGDWR